MKITAQLKGWLAEQGVKPDATETEVRRFVADALVKGTLTDAKYVEMSRDSDATGGTALLATLEKMNARLDRIEGGAAGEKGTLRSDAPRMPGSENPSEPTYFEKTLAGVSSEGSGGTMVRVKNAHEQYDRSRGELRFPSTKNRGGLGVPHPLAGQKAFEGYGGNGIAPRPLYMPSQLDKALAGAYIKFSVHASLGGRNIPRPLRMTDHDKDLMQYLIQECEWGGVLHGEGSEVEGAIGLKGEKLSPFYQKALLDDSTSGGLEAAPILFDDMLITTPLLYGEFFPKVRVVNITRGRRVEGAQMSNVTLGSSTEGTAITLFNTANFIAAFDTTIFVCAGAIEIGLDFLSDSPIDIAAQVAESYQNSMLKWLDDQIIDGDGTTEPEGIMQASGTVTVNATNGSGGPWTVGDQEALLFGVAKQYKDGDPNRTGFGANELTYRRIRGIAVGTTDQRRVFGMTHEDYRLLDRFFGINGSFGNREEIFGNFFRYRMYRRLGMTVRTETAGSTLVRANTMLMVARSRWGGQLEDGLAFAVCADGQS